MTFKQKLNLLLSNEITLKFTSSFGFSRGFFHVSVSSTSSFNSFTVWNRYPFSVLVKFELWNLIIFMICIVFQRLSRNLPMFVFVFAKKLTGISLAIVLVPGPSGNTKLYCHCTLMTSIRFSSSSYELTNPPKTSPKYIQNSTVQDVMLLCIL